MKKQFLASSGSLINLFKIVLLFILLEQFVQLSRLVLSNSRTAFLIIFFENLLLEPFLGLLKSKLDSAGAIQSDLLCRDRWDHWMDNSVNEGSVTSSLFNQSFHTAKFIFLSDWLKRLTFVLYIVLTQEPLLLSWFF